MAIDREDVGAVLKDQKRENFVQEWALSGDRNGAFLKIFDPEGKKTRAKVNAAAWKLEQIDSIRARLQVLQQAKAKAAIDSHVISQEAVLKKMLEFTERMNEQGLPSQEAKGIDMLAKATGVYKAPEKNEKPRDRTDEEIKRELEQLGLTVNADTPNRTANGPGGGTADPQASDLSALPEAAGLSRTRPN